MFLHLIFIKAIFLVQYDLVYEILNCAIIVIDNEMEYMFIYLILL